MAAVTDVNYALTPDQHARELRRAVVAATVGTTIEWYDFLLYSTMAGLVFGKLFFPNEDPLTATLSAFGIYFIGFVARPIGAFIFGHYGDRIGRKSTLIVTLVLMGVSTFLVAFLPGYAVIGIWGAVLLTILRLIQGIGVGGEWGGSVLLSMEWARHNNERGFLASWPQFGGPAGLGLANLAVLIFSYWSGDQFLVWGWRIPFALSIVLVGIGLWIRLRILETPVFRNLVNETQDRAGADRRSVPQAMGHHHPRRAGAHLGAGPVLHLHRLHLRLRHHGAACVARPVAGGRARRRCCCRPSPFRSAAICPT